MCREQSDRLVSVLLLLVCTAVYRSYAYLLCVGNGSDENVSDSEITLGGTNATTTATTGTAAPNAPLSPTKPIDPTATVSGGVSVPVSGAGDTNPLKTSGGKSKSPPKRERAPTLTEMG